MTSRRYDEGGFTLVEMAIGTMLAAIVAALLLSSLVSAQQSEVHLQEISASQEDLRRAIVEITRDIRAAEPLWYDATLTPTASADTELRLEHWERAGTTPTRLRWRIDGDELVREVLTTVDTDGDSHPDTVVAGDTTYRLRGVDPTTSAFSFTMPDPSAPTQGKAVQPNDAARLSNCVNKVFVMLRAAAVNGRHPSSVYTEINLRNRYGMPGYC